MSIFHMFKFLLRVLLDEVSFSGYNSNSLVSLGPNQTETGICCRQGDLRRALVPTELRTLLFSCTCWLWSAGKASHRFDNPVFHKAKHLRLSYYSLLLRLVGIRPKRL